MADAAWSMYWYNIRHCEAWALVKLCRLQEGWEVQRTSVERLALGRTVVVVIIAVAAAQAGNHATSRLPRVELKLKLFGPSQLFTLQPGHHNTTACKIGL
jgi:hypothetical protein